MIDKPEGVEEIGSEHIFQETRDKASNLLYLKYQKAVKKFNIDSGTGYDNPSEQLERVVKFLENNINLRTIANYLENNSDIKYLVFAYQKGDLSESVANLYVKNATDGKGLDEFLTILLKKITSKDTIYDIATSSVSDTTPLFQEAYRANAQEAKNMLDIMKQKAVTDFEKGFEEQGSPYQQAYSVITFLNTNINELELQQHFVDVPGNLTLLNECFKLNNTGAALANLWLPLADQMTFEVFLVEAFCASINVSDLQKAIDIRKGTESDSMSPEELGDEDIEMIETEEYIEEYDIEKQWGIFNVKIPSGKSAKFEKLAGFTDVHIGANSSVLIDFAGHGSIIQLEKDSFVQINNTTLTCHDQPIVIRVKDINDVRCNGIPASHIKIIVEQ